MLVQLYTRLLSSNKFARTIVMKPMYIKPRTCITPTDSIFQPNIAMFLMAPELAVLVVAMPVPTSVGVPEGVTDADETTWFSSAWKMLRRPLPPQNVVRVLSPVQGMLQSDWFCAQGPPT